MLVGGSPKRDVLVLPFLLPVVPPENVKNSFAQYPNLMLFIFFLTHCMFIRSEHEKISQLKPREKKPL